MLKDLFAQIKSKLDDSEQDPLAAEDTNSPITKLTTDKLKAIVADLTSAAPIFEQAGFEMEQLEVEVGLIPKITPQFVQTKKISAIEEQEIIAQLKQRKLLQFVMQSLFKSSKMQGLLSDTSLKLHAIEVEISAPPSVRTIFKRTHSSAKETESDIVVTDSQVHH